MTNKEIMQNKALWERVSAFNPQSPIRIGKPFEPDSKTVDALEYLDDGSVMVRMYAPTAGTVTIGSGGIAVYKFKVELQRREDGVFEGAIPANKSLRGNIVVECQVDGATVIHPYLPVQFYGGRIANFIEVPDWETPYILLNDVPHGSVNREIFWSETVGSWQRCMVYTPPMYQEGGEYPVLYLQHGGGENETGWVFNGKLPYILDNVLAESKGVPFIVVMNDGLVKVPGQTGTNDFDGIEGIITKDCRKFIETRYRVKTDKWNRAIAGLSLGSMQASYIGMGHPELFASIGSFTYLRCRDKDNTHEGNPHLNVLRDPERFWKDYKLLFRSLGECERSVNEFADDDELIRSCGIDKNPGYVRKMYPEMTHDWNCWRRAIYDFAQVVFRAPGR